MQTMPLTPRSPVSQWYSFFRGSMLWSLGALVATIPALASDKLVSKIPASFALAGAQYERLLEAVRDSPDLPRTFENGSLTTVPPKDWTSGFFPGSLWYLYEFTRDPKWLAAATDCTARLETVKNYRGSHDVGFMLGCSYGNGWRLTKNTGWRDVMMEGAATLATRFNPDLGLIRSWDHGSWTYPVIIDNLMNLEFLMVAARESGKPRFREIAVSHADKTLQNHFRTDASCFHVVDYDPANGRVLSKKTHQGAADGSSWARGQAWALYGYTMMFRETGDQKYLTQATKVADFILDQPRLPADKIPYWDFDAPGIPDVPRDASAAAVMSSALIELSDQVGAASGERYLDLARRQLLSLSSPDYFAKPGENGNFILMHCVGNMPKKSEVDVPLNYADYYYLEAMLRYHRKFSKNP
jgi:unsaturated chondroitin disaccharide hydrolase